MARVATHLRVSELEREYRAAKDATAARHYQAIWLLAQGHTVPEVAERPVLLRRPGNAGGGKGPWFKAGAGSGKAREIGATLLNSVDV